MSDLRRFERDDKPEYYPGNDFARRGPTREGITLKFYERYHYTLAHTTSGQRHLLPTIEHRALTESGDASTYDGAQTVIPVEHLNDAQQRAVSKAQNLRRLRENKKLPIDTFPNMRGLVVDDQNLLWVCSPEEGFDMDKNELQFPLHSAQALADICVASAAYGEHVFPKYDQADLDRFVPPRLQERANAYLFLDAGYYGWRAIEHVGPRQLADPDGYDAWEQRTVDAPEETWLAQIRLFEVSTDTSYFPEV